MKNRLLIVCLLIWLPVNFNIMAQTNNTISHNIGDGSLTISENSPNNYIITGTTEINNIEVKTGYRGTITLRGVNISIATNSPIIIRGENYKSNMTPVTKVDIILDGNNVLHYNGENGRAALQVEQGAQIDIRAINPSDNASGTLEAMVSSMFGGAGIGALNRFFSSKDESIAQTFDFTGDCSETPVTTAGGNIVISSGTVTARGGHGAGIGGGFQTYYDGMILIYGGDVEASAQFDAAGIGSGCPTGNGILPNCYTSNSSIIVLPPANISTLGAGATKEGGVGSNLFSELGLSGTANITYIGDTTKRLITVRTEDFIPNANIYVDLSQSPEIKRVIDSTILDKTRLDVNKVKFGETEDNGLYQFHGFINNNTTFFTDTVSETGRPYMPEVVVIPNVSEDTLIILKPLETEISLTPIPSTPLIEGYSESEALVNAYRIKIEYKDDVPMENVKFDMAGEEHFLTSDLMFYLPNGNILPAAPSSLEKGDVLFVTIPIQQGKTVYDYEGVLRIIGTWSGKSTGYIRQIVNQKVIIRINAATPECTNCPGSFAPYPGKEYVFGGWVKDATALAAGAVTYKNNCHISLSFDLVGTDTPFDTIIQPTGAIIDGWQRMQEVVKIPSNAHTMRLELVNNTAEDDHEVYFDDIRVYPANGSMKSYVYDPVTRRLVAELDEENYATFYEYDEEGALIRVKKETERGIMTIREARQGQRKQP